jgi:CBS domain-containing protein
VDFQLSLHSDTVTAANPDGPLATAADASIASVMQLLKMQRTGAALVYEGDKLAGVFTERDALKLMRQRADLTRPVREVMSASPVTISSKATVSEAIRQMSAGGYRHLPIVDEQGQSTGVIAVRGIVHYLVEHFPATIYNLPPKPGTAPAQREGA